MLRSLTIWGLLMQRFSFAVIMPLYLVLHLSTSPTAWSRKPSDFYVDSAEHATILASITVGFLVPTILMVLPAPSVISFDKKQTYLAFWQVFPIWVQLFQKARFFLPKILTSDHKKISAKSIKLDREYLFSLRFIYAILLAFAGCTHIATMTLLITSKFFPGLFAEEFVGVFNPSKVFWPLSISVSTKMRSIGSGIFQFLQYDEFVGSIAVCFWASFLPAKVLNKENIRNPGKARSVLKSWLPVQSLLSVSLFGPLGYAVICIWARDEAIMNEAKMNTAAGGEEKEKR